MVNKNQTAVERSKIGENPSGKTCARCDREIKLKELVNVRQISFETGRKAMVSYHKACYG